MRGALSRGGIGLRYFCKSGIFLESSRGDWAALHYLVMGCRVVGDKLEKLRL